MENTNTHKRYDTFLRNVQRLERLWKIEDSEFRKSIESIQTKWILPNRELEPLLLENKDIPVKDLIRVSKERIPTKAECVEEKKRKFYSKLRRRNKLSKFWNDIANILDAYHLGVEWLESIAELIITGFCIPPVYNFGIEWDRKYIFLILNSVTSLRDIKEAWRYINQMKILFFSRDDKVIQQTPQFIRIKNKYPYLKCPFNFEIGHWKSFLFVFLNQTTSYRDIQKGWSWINMLKKEFYPNIKKPHVRREQWKNLEFTKGDKVFLELIQNTSKHRINMYQTINFNFLDELTFIFNKIKYDDLPKDKTGIVRLKKRIEEVKPEQLPYINPSSEYWKQIKKRFKKERMT